CWMKNADLHFDDITLQSYFQPIVSIKTASVIGYEALVRGCDGRNEIVSPKVLFERAVTSEQRIDLDRLCRDSAARSFGEIGHRSGQPLLFLNFESSLIDMGVVGSGTLSRQCAEAGIAPSRVVIEIIESKVDDLDSMRRFIDTHRSQGFIIALDDVGEGYSNLSRIALVRPDIIKIDRSLISGLSRDYMKQQIVCSLASLSHGIGALICAEGIETDDDAIAALDSGADLLQGYIFAKPCPAGEMDQHNLDACIDELFGIYRKHSVTAAEKDRLVRRRHRDALSGAVRELTRAGASDFDLIVSRYLDCMDECECMYVLDGHGCQITNSIVRECKSGERRAPAIFHPADPGTDHSRKEYFYAIAHTGSDHYTSPSYISSASGNLCRTVSLAFTHELLNSRFLLCADFIVQDDCR
ncbi:MAG TPA: EAL domain-containing protein, partial [Spirochaetota bacterium]